MKRRHPRPDQGSGARRPASAKRAAQGHGASGGCAAGVELRILGLQSLAAGQCQIEL
jgi:hypothetical protein